MNHFQARARLADLVDGGLCGNVEAEVRAHVAECERCRRRLGELELCETLLQRMPHSVAPLDLEPAAYGRLVRLAHWSEEPELPERERWRAPTLGFAGLVAAAALALTMVAWRPVMLEPWLLSISVIPQETVVLPVGWRPGQ